MNVYDFSYKTGSNFNTLYSPIEDTNKEDFYFNDSLFLTSDAITGINQTRLSFNGQTLLEQTAVLYNIGFDQVYLNSGHYYIKSGESFKSVAFDEKFDTSIASNFPFYYNIKDDTREAAVGTGITRVAKRNNLTGEIAAKYPDRFATYTGMSSFDYFYNGQKLYSGANVNLGSYNINSFGTLFYFDFGGATSLPWTGELFAIIKNSGLKNITGNSPDIYGDKFVENTVFGYINGVSLHKKNWLELSTGVKLIATGLQASIFDPIIKNTQIQL